MVAGLVEGHGAYGSRGRQLLPGALERAGRAISARDALGHLAQCCYLTEPGPCRGLWSIRSTQTSLGM